VELRALIPPGLRERFGAADAAALVAGWFADSTELDLAGSEIGEVGDRLHISYRFEGVEEGEAYVVEHHLYCTLDERGLIQRADLLCSGFRPSSEPAQQMEQRRRILDDEVGGGA
jgi:hypothetical protein